jgi:hypothetical protein
MPADYAIRIETLNASEIKIIHNFTEFFNARTQIFGISAFAENILGGILLFFDKITDFQRYHNLYNRIGTELAEKVKRLEPGPDNGEVFLEITVERLPRSQTIADDIMPIIYPAYETLPAGIYLDRQSNNHAHLCFPSSQLFHMFFDTFNEILAENV